jgi:transposase
MRPVLCEMAREIWELERRIHDLASQLEAMARASDVVVRLRTIPGIGLLTRTALVALVGDARRFPSFGPALRELSGPHPA